MNKWHLNDVLTERFSLLSILLGSALISISLGPYTNGDSQLEYSWANLLFRFGLPYSTLGKLINQPPVGFYVEALFFKFFGLSYQGGVTIMTLFGLGSTFLVFEVGKALYGKRTGLLSAAIFALTPWQVVFSRTFLIDSQCLFLSLLCLFVGILAIRKGSLKLLFLSGAIFGVAFLTKFYAIYILIPLTLIYFHKRPKDLKKTLAGVALFIFPAFLFYYLWYGELSGLGLLSVFNSSDFTRINWIRPSMFFLVNYFIGALGALFLIASAISLFISFFQRKLFASFSFFDLVCFVTIAIVGGVNMFLTLGLNLRIPFVDPIKYDYLILPAFCWLAASLVEKCYVMHSSVQLNEKQNKLIFSAAIAGLSLLVGSIIVDMKTLNAFIGQTSIIFWVEQNTGYSFTSLTPIIRTDYLVDIQGLGFALVLLGLTLSAVRFSRTRKEMQRI